MSEFLASRFANACPYRPGEQPKDRTYVKLNANETSVAPSPRVRDALRDEGLFEGLGRSSWCAAPFFGSLYHAQKIYLITT